MIFRVRIYDSLRYISHILHRVNQFFLYLFFVLSLPSRLDLVDFVRVRVVVADNVLQSFLEPSSILVVMVSQDFAPGGCGGTCFALGPP